jgi:hypothetical protein
MTAEIFPFPLARRLNLVRRQAEYSLTLKPEKGEAHIQRQLESQAEALRRRGVPEDAISREIAGLQAAIQSAMWHILFDAPSERA